MNTSMEWIKRVTEIGLTFMTSKAQKEKLEGVVTSDQGTGESAINVNAVAELIDECVAAAGAFLQKNENSTAISDADKDLISSLLGKVDGKTVVAETKSSTVYP